jgi:murein L,D-transpeptidase YcbB/YkuD
MKKFVTRSVLVALSAMMLAGTALAEKPVRKHKPGFLEQLFGTSSSHPTTKKRRSLFGSFKDDPFYVEDETSGSRKGRVVIVDADPEDAVPGYGMGNLTYVPPKMVALSGVSLATAAPADPAAAAVYGQLTAEGPSLRVLPAARDALLAQYAAQDYRPIWLKDGKLTQRGQDVLKLLAASAEDGLQPQTYLPTGLASFDSPLPENDPAAMARLDIDLSAASLRYARDASGGQFDPALLSRYNDLQPPWVAPAQALRVIAFSPFAADYLQGLNPAHPAFAAMKKALAALRAEQDAPKPDKIADGELVKKGDADDRIPAVRARLKELGFAAAAAAEADSEVVDAAPSVEAGSDVLDAELSVQLRLFQKQAGVKVTGALGPQTVAALNNAGTSGSVDKLLDNMERLRWLPRDLGRRYVFVNQAAFQASVIKDGKPEWTTRVIVGKPDTQTSVFNDEMEMVVFNPSWGVPPSIIANEYLPKLRQDPGYLDRMGFKVVTQQGKVVSSRAINWDSYGSKIPYGIQQPPGVKNALGELKFLFPNAHDIYMHDTPSRELFERDMRAFSHGCVRVQNPREFASVVLGWTPEEVAAKVETRASETVRLKEKLPVHITYFTAWPDEAGNMVYFNDIYGRDKPIENARSATLVAQR